MRLQFFLFPNIKFKENPSYVSKSNTCGRKGENDEVNLLEPELFFLILTHPVYKM